MAYFTYKVVFPSQVKGERLKIVCIMLRGFKSHCYHYSFFLLHIYDIYYIMNSTVITDNSIQYSVQYIIICGYVILSWGTFNLVSLLSKCMYIYLLLNN